MPLDRLIAELDRLVTRLDEQGMAKGVELVIREVVRPDGEKGPRYLLEGQGNRAFIRMNSNSYLGLALHPEVIRAEEATARALGTGPGAARFIAGTHTPHVELEHALTAFHRREEGMIFSSAYAAVMGTLVSLIDPTTAVISDELNHNSIINAVRLARPLSKSVYPHLDMAALDHQIAVAAGRARRAIVVTDGIFSMRGDHAPLDEIMDIARRHDHSFPENVVVVVDDSHGVGAFRRHGPGRRGIHREPARGHPHRHPGQGPGGQRGVRGLPKSGDPLPPGDLPLLHLLQPDHRRRSKRRSYLPGDTGQSRRGGASKTPARPHSPTRVQLGGAGLRDHSR